MDDRFFRRVDSVLREALEHPPDEREAFIDSACGDDVELAREVRNLLGAGLEDDGFLRPGGALSGAVWEEMTGGRELRRQPETIGPYRIHEQIGRGGMGAVYLAGRETGGDEDRVALKLLHEAGWSKDTMIRFDQERSILSSLNHPGIARYLDSGVTDGGRPFLAMEYVEGLPIDRFCDENRLRMEQRLRLFIDTARAVTHAHRAMVVHRDIKPSNILVTADHQVKLLDFGIARILDESPAVPAGGLTRTGLRVLTPEYASPEQMRGELVTTASDVYQLGLVLYVLLTGQHPYRLEGRTVTELERVICEQPVMTPSAAVVRAAGSSENSDDGRTAMEYAAHARGSRPDRLRRSLRGDLDTIVKMALRKEPERRYLSVEQLTRDIDRHLEGRPISARKDTVMYRMGKLVRRHPWRLAAGASMMALVVALSGMTLERQSSENERMRLEAERSQQVAGFLQGLFDIDQTTPAAGETVTARELLDRGASTLEEDLDNQPQLQATLQGLLGEMYRKLGQFDQAQRLLDESLETNRAIHGPEHPAVLASLVGHARLLADLGRFDEAEASYAGALEGYRGSSGDVSRDAALCRFHLAELYVLMGRYEEAEPLFSDALDGLSNSPDTRDAELAASVTGLSSLYWSQGRYEEAEPMLIRARAIYEALPRQSARELAGVLGSLGQIAERRGDFESAEPLLGRSHEILEDQLGPDHPDVAMALASIARLYSEQGRLDEAEPLYLNALQTLEEAYPEDHPDVGECLNDLALMYWGQGDLDRAEPLLERALAIGIQTLGADHPDVGAATNSLGALYARQGNPEEAERSYRQALMIMNKSLGSDHPYVAAVRVNLTGVLRELGRQDEAVPLCEEAVAINRRALGEDHVDVARSRSMLAALYLDLGRPEEAAALLDQAIPVLEATFGPTHPTVATALDRRRQAEAR